MEFKIKYLLIVFFLSTGFVSSEAHNYIDNQMLSHNTETVSAYEYNAPDHQKAINELSVFLFHNFFIGSDKDHHSPVFYPIKEQNYLSQNRVLFLGESVQHSFVRPLKYYIFTLEKIVI